MGKGLLFATALGSFILVGCGGGTDKVPEINSLDAINSDQNSQINAGEPYFLCASPDAGEIVIQSSNAGENDRGTRYFAPGSSMELEAPALLSLQGGMLHGLFTASAAGGGGGGSAFASAPEVQIAAYDLQAGAEVGPNRVKLTTLPANYKEVAAIYNGLGLPNPRYYSQENATGTFFIAHKGAYSLRRTTRPELEVDRWIVDGSVYLQPRWDHFPDHPRLFLDSVQNKLIRQSFVYQKKDGKVYIESIPAPSLATAGVHQLGLQRFSESTYSWLEWKQGHALLRMMDVNTRKVFDLKLPDAGPGKHGAGYAFYHLPRVGRVVAVPGASALHFYRFEFGALKLEQTIPYAPSVLEYLSEFKGSWIPAEIYVNSTEEHLFVSLPERDRLHIFGYLAAGKRLERKGSQSCANASLQRQATAAVALPPKDIEFNQLIQSK